MTIKEMFETIRKQSKYYDYIVCLEIIDNISNERRGITVYLDYDVNDDTFEWGFQWWDFDIDYNTLVVGIVPLIY